MLQSNQQVRTLGVVVLGKFNPAIIQPYWLSGKKLIQESEAKSANIEIVHPQLTRITIGDWLFLEVSNERFEFRSSQEGFFPTMKDLILGIFKSLPETPISGFGINHIMHFLITNPQKYFEFGNTYAPLQSWNEIMKEPRLLNLHIIENKRRDGREGHFSLKIEPSNLLEIKKGVALSVNDHIAFGDKGDGLTLIKNIIECWEPSFERATEVVDKISVDLKY